MSSGIVYEELLPINSEPVDVLPGDGHLAQINESNEWLLRANLSLNDKPDIEESNEASAEIQRLDLKLNLVLSLIGEVLAKQLDIPSATEAKLTAHSLQWQGEQQYQTGNLLRLSVYINAELPKSLQLYGRVVSSDVEWTEVEFIGVNQAVKDWLEKLIFRHHRRTIAQSKGANR